MYHQPEEILKLYDLEVRQIIKGRGAFICETNRGFYLLKEFGGSEERAHFLAEVLREVRDGGFLVEQILFNTEGKALSEDEYGTKYFLKDYFAGTECSVKSREDMKAAAKCLARLHKAFQGCRCAIPDALRDGAEDLAVIYERHNREMTKVKNYVRTRKKKNEFEMKFQEHYPYFMESAKRVTEQLKEAAEETVSCFLCHGDYNQHNVIYTEAGWRVVNLEFLCYRLQVVDLSNFLRKMMEKNAWNPKLGMELLESYTGERPFLDGELRRLYLAMAYPEKFWKVASHYYNSHKAWLSGRNIEKLDKVIEQEKAREEFLEKLFSFAI